MKSFVVVRTEDVSGVSGVGVVAEGLVFSSGRVFIEWYGPLHSWEIHDDMDTFLKVHGHGGKTTVKFTGEK